MKCIGLLGGMSWESTVSYYQALNRGVRERLGGLHSARVLLSSVDFAEIERLQISGTGPPPPVCWRPRRGPSRPVAPTFC